MTSRRARARRPPLRRPRLSRPSQATSAGRPLERDVQARMRPDSVDRSSTRVHADARAARLADTVDARAFAYGQDVYFGEREYRPGTAEGDRLLAHELAHTIQQPAAGTVARQRQPRAQEARTCEGVPQAPSRADDR